MEYWNTHSAVSFTRVGNGCRSGQREGDGEAGLIERENHLASFNAMLTGVVHGFGAVSEILRLFGFGGPGIGLTNVKPAYGIAE
jgi:hypothetical protein